jgi:inner membrane protein
MLAGATVAWAIDPRADRRLTLTAAALAAAPDLDLLLGLVLPIHHRTITHSVAAVAAVTIVTMVVTGKVNRAAACGCAAASHLLLDWLQIDRVAPYGLQALWPFSHQFYLSGLDWFRGTARTNIFSPAAMMTNAKAIVQEIGILGPIVGLVYLVRIKPASRFAPEVAGRNHPAE